MVLPCPICREPANGTNGRTFPEFNSDTRYNYCVALGVPEEVFQNIQTRRHICFKHFDDNMFAQRGKKKLLKFGALPRKLTEAEKNIVLNNRFSNGCYRNPNMANSSSQQHVFEVISPSTPSTSFQHPSLPLSTPSAKEFTPETPSSSTTVYHSDDFDFLEQSNIPCGENIEIPEQTHPQKIQKSNPKYVMVQHDKLLQLCRHCIRCGHIPEKANPSSTFFGTACKIKLWCHNCKDYIEWESQDRISGRNIYKGNVEVASAIAAAPLPVARFLQFALILNLAMIDHSTYYRYMPTFWTVVSDAYSNMQKKVFNYLQVKKEQIHLAADGQFDTRGFSALMCCVTVMDAVSRLILTTVCLNKNDEKCPSTNLERRGLERALTYLIGKNLIITTVTTDRSTSVIALMKDNFPEIIHMYDPWHLIKGIAAILRKECKNNRAQSFKDWCQALLNQLWYSVTSAEGKGSLCQQYAVSSLLHTIGIHKWEEGIMSKVLHDNLALALDVDSEEAFFNDPLDLPGKLIHEKKFEEFLECGHGLPFTETGTKSILCPLSKSYSILQKAFTNDNFLTDLLHLSPKLATSSLEGFHGLVSNIYRTKNHFFDLDGFTNRTKLAVLHYNNNVFDEINGNRKVIGTTQMKAKHRGGELVTKKRKTPPDFTWKKKLIDDVVAAFENKMDLLLKEGIFEDNFEVEMDEEWEDGDDRDIEDKIDDLFQSDVEEELPYLRDGEFDVEEN